MLLTDNQVGLLVERLEPGPQEDPHETLGELALGAQGVAVIGDHVGEVGRHRPDELLAVAAHAEERGIGAHELEPHVGHGDDHAPHGAHGALAARPLLDHHRSADLDAPPRRHLLLPGLILREELHGADVERLHRPRHLGGGGPRPVLREGARAREQVLMIGDEGGADEVDLAEVRAEPVREEGGTIALELVEGGHALARQPDEGPDAEDDEGRVHGSAHEQTQVGHRFLLARVHAIPTSCADPERHDLARGGRGRRPDNARLPGSLSIASCARGPWPDRGAGHKQNLVLKKATAPAYALGTRVDRGSPT